MQRTPTLGLLVGCLLICGGAWAQPPDQEQLDEWFLKAESAFGFGRDRKGLELIDRVLESRPDDIEAMALAVGPARNVGEHDKAEAWLRRLLVAHPDEKRHRLDLVEALMLRGRLADAEETLSPLLAMADEPDANELALDMEAQALLARMRLLRGRREEAKQIYHLLVQEARRVRVDEPRDLVALAEAYVFFRGIREAEKVLIEAQEAAKGTTPTDPVPSLALGQLYLTKMYLPGDAVEEFKEALEARPGLTAAHWGQAEAYEAWGKGLAELSRRRVRANDPNHPGALLQQVTKMLGDMELEQAQELLDRVFEVNPTHQVGMALQAVKELFDGRREAYDTKLAELAALDPTNASAHLAIAEVMNERRRWTEALEHCRRATEVDPDDLRAWDERARYAFFLGLSEEGEKALKEADRLDRFTHPWRTNMFTVRGVLKTWYDDVSTDHFVHRFLRSQKAVLQPYIVPFCEDSHAFLSKKYTFDPPGLASQPGKILVEWLKTREDFSVRTLGFTHLGATGVCFGPFIGMNSPSAMKPGEFSWARTFHHELAHTMTIGLAKGRMPRWLTEGLSTYEELCFDASWDRGHYRELFDAYHADDLCKVLTFDAAFGTSRIAYAYFQGGLTCQWMADRFGMEKIIAMLKAYGEDKTTAQIVPEVLGVTPEAFDAEFKEWVREKLEPVRLLPRWSDGKMLALEAAHRERDKDLGVLIDLISAYLDRQLNLDAQELMLRARNLGEDDPRLDFLQGRLAFASKTWPAATAAYERAMEKGFENHDMRMHLAKMSQDAGKTDEARAHLEKAVEAFPMVNGKGDPRLVLAGIAQGQGDLDGAVAWMEEHLKRTYENLEVRTQLVNLYRQRDDKESIERHLQAMIWIYPLDRQVHHWLGELHLAKKASEAAVREFEVALALLPEKDRNPAEEAEIRVRLAEAWILDEDGIGEAEAQLNTALELVPGYGAAEKLLKELSDRRRRAPGDGR